MTEIDEELPPAIASLWRSIKFGFRAERRYLPVTFGITLTTVLPELLLVLLLKALTSAGTQNNPIVVAAVCAGIAAVAIGQWLIRVAAERLQLRFTGRIAIALEAHVASLQAGIAGLAHHERPKYLDRLAVLRDQVFALNRLYVSIFSTAAAAVRALLIIALLASVHPALTLLGLFALVPILVSGWSARRVRDVQQRVASSDRRARHMFVLATEASSARDLRMSLIRDATSAKHAQARRDWYVGVASFRWRGARWQAGAWLFFAAAYVFALYRVAATPSFSLGDVLVLLIAGSRISQAINDLVTEANFLQGDWLGAAQSLAWLEDFAAAGRISKSQPPDSLNSGIRLDHVSFKYHDDDRYVLDDVNLFLPAGSVVAIVGENGAGKTTLVKLICRLYEPSHGRIMIDDECLADIAVPAWRRRLSGTFQDFFTFEFTALQCVGIGDLPFIDDRDSVAEAVDRAGAAPITERLQYGLDSQLGAAWKDGTDLSAGQWQRLAVARGLMRPAPLIQILDEPSSALDAAAEAELFERYTRASRSSDLQKSGGITVLISHRFSTVRAADLIVVMDGARIAETGTHQELIATGGIYAELYEKQASGYR